MFDSLSDKLTGIFKDLNKKGKLSESDIDNCLKQVRMALLEADVNFKVVKNFCKQAKERCMDASVLESLTPGQNVLRVVVDLLKELLGTDAYRVDFGSKIPGIVMLVGLQGSGKTTACAKLACKFKKQGHAPLLVACDIYRPAAIDQLKTLGKENDIAVFSEECKSAVDIAKDSLKYAKENLKDIIIVYSAGRMHVDEEMMKEASDIKSAITPDYTFLVVDSMTGQDAVNVATNFAKLVNFDALIMTKLDGDARGGAALSIREVSTKPIAYISSGEKMDSLDVFHPDRLAKRILGMGDILTVIEKAVEAQDKEIELAEKERLAKSQFGLDDFMDVIRQTRKMGGLSKVVEN
ncbi:MAG: signal recognition particle protein Srp54 [Coriobacteriales bacterium]|nr:signal recognition particle protein Srp54 [Coriobacteriales bacterium]